MRRRFVTVVVALTLLAGYAFARGPQAPLVTLPDTQQEALFQLPDVTKIELDDNGVPTFVAGRLGVLPRGDHGSASLHFLGRVGGIFRATGREEMAITRVRQDEVGKVHVRMQQYFRGLPVVGAELIVHSDALTGEVYAINGRFTPDEGLPKRPEIDAQKALQIAAMEAGIVQGTVLEQPKLVYYTTPDAKAYLAWTAPIQFEQAGEPHIDQVYADALIGGLVGAQALNHSARNRKIYHGNNTNPDNPNLPGTLLFQEGATSSSDAAAWDAYVYFGSTYDYFQSKFARDSFDNAGKAIVGTVHVGTNYVNAYWSSYYQQFVFGDGNGTTATYLSKALDVVAHEFTHAVTSYEANLAYQNDSGALNEAMSDVFAAAVEAWKDGSINSDTWKIGEDCWTPATAGDALRYMNNPTQDGSSADYYPERNYATGCTPSSSNDYCGVHTNSGIGNLAFYLLTQGGTHPRNKTTTQVPGIGIAKSEKIFYKSLADYMTSSTTFAQARTHMAQAATDLYTSTEVDAVNKCWEAVGVGATAPPTVVTISNGQTVTGISATVGAWKYYKLAVPSGQTKLEVKTTGGLTGQDADLFVKLGGTPTTSSYTSKSEGSTCVETVTITNPAAGDWYIGIYAYKAFSSVSLNATYTGSTTTPNFTIAASPTSLSVAQGASGTVSISTTVSGGFNSAVALSASGVPSGASVSFNPTSIAAPGSGSSTMTVNGGTAAAGTYTITVTGSGGGLTKTATVSLTVTATSGPVVLSNGVALTGQSASLQTWKYYKIAVPTGQASLVVESSGGSGDADLYVRLGSNPTTTTNNGKSTGSTSTEKVTITSPAAGDWYIGLYAYSAFSSVTIKATYTASSGGTTMNETESNNTTGTANTVSTSGTVVTGYIGTSTDVDYFKVTVAAGRTLTVDLTVPSTKDYDLGLYNSAGTLLKSGTNGTGVAEKVTYTNSTTTSQVYYIKVYGYSGAYSTTLSYQLKPTW